MMFSASVTELVLCALGRTIEDALFAAPNVSLMSPFLSEGHIFQTFVLLRSRRKFDASAGPQNTASLGRLLFSQCISG